ncbi:SirB2 family protein [Nitrosococcus oceani]|uniref:Invasion gene expression up-regulator, SirB n=2 Tax=Nitrosococcus oceani TaxID=1229 RepID=Q3J8K9_NITOC|nr:SirB2 family protein [Nitrosococcus oceani]ABA58837.1 Invasion gene expression up-regulator, SirB [Nitrosococcus oceani ATCC 19707]KFI18638.1 invasion protein [Nitrosococcus oceani C-27]KFI21980.1 invasion protein [Nitrosococcus oceani]GEM19072.1 invasion protein [Nitrosococcus oceani]
MMTVYLTLKYIHLTSVVTTLVLFVGRGLWMLSSSHYLQRRWVRLVPPIVDTVLLASAIGLTLVLHQYPFVNDWLTAKILALIGYIVFGSIALKYGRTRSVRIGAGCIAMILFTYMVWVARSKTPFPWLL